MAATATTELDGIASASAPGATQRLERASGPDKSRYIDTTQASIIHWVAAKAGAMGGDRLSPSARCVILVAAITVAPLLLFAALEFPLAQLLAPHEDVRLPLLRDWNILFLLLVTLPMLTAYLVSDDSFVDRAIATALRTGDGSAQSEIEEQKAARQCRERFANVNVAAQIVATAVGVIVAYLNYLAYRNPAVGYWIANRTGLYATGWVYLWVIAVFYWVVVVYVARSIAMSVYLKALVAHGKIKFVVLHPDNCGGLRRIGDIGLRNQYTLSVVGINLLLLFYFYPRTLSLPAVASDLIITAAIAYLVCGPIVFLGPLLPFRDGMKRNRDAVLDLLGKRTEMRLTELRTHIERGTLPAEDKEDIDRLRSIGEAVDQYPVWPFDARTIRKFAAAYLIPISTSVALPWVRDIIQAVLHGL